MVPKPAVPPADDKDWTWVLREPCKECGFDAATIRPKRLAEAVRETASRWPAVLVQPEVAERVELMLAQDNTVCANWDQDETA